jgi:8-oxo-dGTP pyrophosphatase MutT (NUDIX family)
MKFYLNVIQVAIEYDEKFLIIKRPEGKHAGVLLAFPGGKVK